MSIHPPSDLVLDVVKAADPAKSMVMTKSLINIGNVYEQENGEFSAVLDKFAPSLDTSLTQVETNKPILAGSIEPLDRTAHAFKELEQLELQKLVEAMLPADAESIFGRGTSGSIWKSMLADALAKDMSKTMDLGLTKAASMRPSYAPSIEAPGQSHDQELAKQHDRRGL